MFAPKKKLVITSSHLCFLHPCTSHRVWTDSYREHWHFNVSVYETDSKILSLRAPASTSAFAFASSIIEYHSGLKLVWRTLKFDSWRDRLTIVLKSCDLTLDKVIFKLRFLQSRLLQEASIPESAIDFRHEHRFLHQNIASRIRNRFSLQIFRSRIKA